MKRELQSRRLEMFTQLYFALCCPRLVGSELMHDLHGTVADINVSEPRFLRYRREFDIKWADDFNGVLRVGCRFMSNDFSAPSERPPPVGREFYRVNSRYR